MRTARPLGLTPDGVYLIVATDDGEELQLPADARLMAALRGDLPRLGQLEIHMDSALRPRDIQARIRAGESPEDVARAAGVPVERIDAFAAPVLAERDHVAGLAQTHPVRRRGETTSHRVLRNAVADALASRGIDADGVAWDAWKLQDRSWRVRASYTSGSAHHEADFTYDQGGRFSVASNDDARWLVGDDGPSHGPQPGRRSHARNPDPALLDDDLALVRAVTAPADPDEAEDEVEDEVEPDAVPSLRAVPAPGASPASPASPVPADEADADAAPTHEDGTQEDRAPEDSDEDLGDAFVEGELTEVDGVYEILPSTTEMDVLYDMLSSFDEDSVRIYAGLVQPREERAPVIVPDPVGELDVDPAPGTEPGPMDEPEPAPAPDPADAAESALTTEPSDELQPVVAHHPIRAGDSALASDPLGEVTEDAAAPAADTAPADDTARADDTAPAVLRPAAEPEQLSLLEHADAEPAAPPTPRPRPRKKRASVPSWDEIVFGGPRSEE